MALVIPELADVRAVASSVSTEFAITGDGALWAWGVRQFGSLGDGATCAQTQTQQAPLRLNDLIPDLPPMVAVMAGDDRFAAAVDEAGNVWTWGRNDRGALGRTTETTCPGPGGVPIPYGAVPEPVVGVSGITAVDSGTNFMMALVGDGTVWAWGVNQQGQLNDGTHDDRPTPIQVPGVSGVVGISNHGNGTITVTANGDMLGWKHYPIPNIRGVTQAALGGVHQLLLVPSGQVYGYGFNSNGELGLEDTYDILHNAPLSTPWAAHAGQGVNVAFGSFHHQQADLAVPGRGAGLALVRTYNSADLADSGFGPGWSFTYGMAIANFQTATAAGMVVRMGDGRHDRYVRNPDGSYTPPPGIYNTLAVTAPDYAFTLTTPGQMVYRFGDRGRLASIADRNGNTTTLTWTASSLTVTEAAGRQFVLTYGTGPDFGHFVKLEEVGILHRVVQYSYDQATGDLTSVTDPRSHLVTMVYEQHRLKAVTNQAGGRVVDNLYDLTSPKVVTQRDAKDYATTFDYSQFGQTTVDGPRVNVADSTIYEYDAQFRVMKITDALGGTTEFTRDANHNPTCVKDRLGGRTRYGYDDRGNVTDFVDARYTNASCEETIRTHITYTVRNDPETITDPRAYDPANQIPTAQLVTTSQYTPEGNLWIVQQPHGHGVTYAYDPSGNGDVTSATDHNGFITSFGYDQWGHLSTVTEPPTEDTVGVGTTTTYEFDAGGRIRAVIDPLGHRTEYSYNPVTAARLIVTERAYPGNGVALVTAYRFDRIGQLVEISDANDNVTAYDYDRVGNLTEVIVGQGTPEQATTTYGYDSAGNRTRWTDADGRETTYGYDALDRLRRVIGPAPVAGEANLETVFIYDDPQRQVRLRDPNGRVTTTTYDPVGQVSGVQYPRVPHPDVRASESFTVGYEYDPAGNRTWMTNGVETAAYSYDGLNRLLSTTTPQPHWGPGQTAVVGYAYDVPNAQLGGARTCTTLTYPQTPRDPRVRAATSCADQAGRLRTVTDWHNRTTTYYYDAAGRLRDTVHPNLTSATFGYDDAGRLTSVVNQRLLDTATIAPTGATLGQPAPVATPTVGEPQGTPGTPARNGTPSAAGTPGTSGTPSRPGPPAPTATPTASSVATATTATQTSPGMGADPYAALDEPLQAMLAAGPFTSHAYTLDGMGNRRFADELTATGAGSGRVEYFYDGQDRLREARFPEIAAAQLFAYSAAGQHQQWQRGGQASGFGYDSAGRLILAHGATYTSDRNGNQTTKTMPDGRGDQTWHYDGANRLDVAIGDEFSSDPRHFFRHDGDGLLVAEKPWVGPWQSYVYDQTQANPAVLVAVTGDGDQVIFSLYGHGLIAQVVTGVQVDDSPKAERTLYYHYDGTGSVRAVTTGRTIRPNGSQAGANGQVVGAYDYQPYGELRRKVITVDITEESPILFAGEPYDKDTGQVYLRARRYDPATGRFTQPDPLNGGWGNPFAYAANNPVTWADHTGYAEEKAQPVPLSARFGAQGGQVGGPPVAPGRAKLATVGTSTSKVYTETFYKAHPHLRGKLDQVHHAVPQVILKRLPGRFTVSEMHSLENLRGIPQGMNKVLHDKLRFYWNGFIRMNPNATREQILNFATRMDDKFGKVFLPQVR